MPQSGDAAEDEPYEHVDCTELHRIQEAVRRYDVGTIYHPAALLSATAEDRPQVAWQLNMGGIYDVLEVARRSGCAVFYPSSIGVFGPRHRPHAGVGRAVA